MAHHRRCAATQMATDLASAATTPNYVWFAANEANNMEGNNDILFALSQIGDHQYDVKAGDKLLADMLPTILNSPAFQTQRTATGRQGHLVAGTTTTTTACCAPLKTPCSFLDSPTMTDSPNP